MATIPQVRRQWDGRYELTFPFSRWVVESLKAEIPAPCREWVPDRKVWIVDAIFASTAISVVRRVYPDLVVIVGQDASPPPRPDSVQPYDPDLAVLHLLPTAPTELVAAAFRCLARLHHPDVGGDTARMQQLNSAYTRLRDRVVS